MSWWTMPCRWAAASPDAAWAAMRAARSAGSGPKAESTRGEAVACDQLHHQEQPVLVRTEVQHADHMRVVEAAGGLCCVRTDMPTS
jgi:hypothetical protein